MSVFTWNIHGSLGPGFPVFGEWGQAVTWLENGRPTTEIPSAHDKVVFSESQNVGDAGNHSAGLIDFQADSATKIYDGNIDNSAPLTANQVVLHDNALVNLDGASINVHTLRIDRGAVFEITNSGAALSPQLWKGSIDIKDLTIEPGGHLAITAGEHVHVGSLHDFAPGGITFGLAGGYGYGYPPDGINDDYAELIVGNHVYDAAHPVPVHTI
jgi:hypothetical protein